MNWSDGGRSSTVRPTRVLTGVIGAGRADVVCRRARPKARRVEVEECMMSRSLYRRLELFAGSESK